MNLLPRFKKDYFNYLISIIIPALINAVSIPLFKRILGAEGYGYFSISFNSLLLLASLLTSWIMQSVIRYLPSVTNRSIFVRKSVMLSVITQLTFFLPVLCSIYYLKGDFILAILFGVTLFIVCIQFVLVSVSQAFFLSGKNIFSEFIRSAGYIAVGLLLLMTTGLPYMYALFAGIFFAFFFSGLYLFVQAKKELAATPTAVDDTKAIGEMFKSFLKYGGPISLWFVFSYSIGLVDKYFMLHSMGANEQGNYQAMFDLLSRSITLLCSPIVISLFPLVTVAYQSNRTAEIKKLLVRIILIEIAALVAALIMYWWFGSAILSAIVKIPDTTEYKLMGETVITGSFMWQIGIVVHKYYEIKFRNAQLLLMISVAFVTQLLFYWFLHDNHSRLVYPSGYALAGALYVVMVSSGVLKSFMNSSIRQQQNP